MITRSLGGWAALSPIGPMQGSFTHTHSGFGLQNADDVIRRAHVSRKRGQQATASRSHQWIASLRPSLCTLLREDEAIHQCPRADSQQKGVTVTELSDWPGYIMYCAMRCILLAEEPGNECLLHVACFLDICQVILPVPVG